MCLADDLHEMPSLVFSEKKQQQQQQKNNKQKNICLSALA